MDLSSGSSTEIKSKTEQIIREAIGKCSQIILQSRIPQTGKTKLNKWFNLEIEEFDIFLEELQMWRSNIQLPLIININYLSQKEKLESVPLERWKIIYEVMTVSNESIEVPTLYKKLIILIRSLYLFVRSTAVYKVFRECKKNKLSSSKITYQLASKLETVNINDHLSEFKFDSVYTPFGKFSVTAYTNEHCSFKQLSAYEDSLLSSRFIIPDYNPDDMSPSHSPVDNKTLPIGIPAKSVNQAAQTRLSIPETPPFSTETFSPPFSSRGVGSATVPTSGSYKAFSTTPPFASNPESNLLNLSSNSPTALNSSKEKGSRPPSLKLNISPFKESSIANTEPLYTSKMKSNAPPTIPLYDTGLPDELPSTKYPAVFTHDATAFMGSVASLSADQDSEVGFFVAQCQAVPALLLVNTIVHATPQRSMAEVITDLQEFEKRID